MKKFYIFISISLIFTIIKTSSILLNSLLYSIAIVLIAILLGDFTYDISELIGEKKGGLLTATIGNLPELMMGLLSIQYGMIPMVKASVIGSIIGNILLVLGISIFFGGIKYKEQVFNKLTARTNFNMLLLAMSAIIVMTSLNKYSTLTITSASKISVKVAIVLILVYILGLIFSLYTHSNLFIVSDTKEIKETKKGKNIKILFLGIIIESILLYIISEKLIVNVKYIVNTYNISQEFLGIILIPILGNIGENISAIMSSLKNKINLSLEIAIGSSIQMALFVTPVLVIYAFFTTVPITLIFTTFQIIIALIAVGMSYFVFQDGKTYWLEGAILIAIYIMITLAYYHIS